jgi:nucleoside-diphosphate-sugar epimerase
LIPPIVKVGNLDTLCSITDVRDVVRAYYLLVTNNPIGGECYNIGSNFTCTLRELLNYLISLSPKKADIKIEIDPERLRPIDADLQVPNSSKFEKHTGWKPQISFEQTMQDLLNYWRDRMNQPVTHLVR